jgi:hypothetical protein
MSSQNLQRRPLTLQQQRKQRDLEFKARQHHPQSKLRSLFNWLQKPKNTKTGGGCGCSGTDNKIFVQAGGSCGMGSCPIQLGGGCGCSGPNNKLIPQAGGSCGMGACPLQLGGSKRKHRKMKRSLKSKKTKKVKRN